MSWSGGTYTKYTSWTAGTTITSTAHNAQDDDFTAGINNCVAKDGSNQMTGNLNMGGFRFTNVAAGSAATPSFSPGADVDTGMYLAGTNTIGFSTAAVERLRIASDGTTTISSAQAFLNVGSSNTATETCALQIGHGRTGDGNAILDLVGDTTYTDFGVRLFRNPGANGATNFVHRGTADCNFVAQEAASITLRTNNLERMRVNSDGIILLGATSPTGTAGCVQIMQRAGGTRWQHGPATTGSGNAFYVLNAADIGVRLDSGNTSWTANSDARQKKNIQDLSYGLNQIQALRPVRFDYLSEESEESKRIGFIAQEVLPYVPEAVSGSEETSYGLATAELIPVLVAAVKELAAKVEALEGL